MGPVQKYIDAKTVREHAGLLHVVNPAKPANNALVTRDLKLSLVPLQAT